MLTRKNLSHSARITLLAFLCNATLPFFVTSAAEAVFNLNGGSKLLCTVQGYQWVDITAPATSDVIVIPSPLAPDIMPSLATENTPSSDHHSNSHCSLCFINPQLTYLTHQNTPSTLTHYYSAEKNILKKYNAFYQQQYLVLPPSRAPPSIA